MFLESRKGRIRFCAYEPCYPQLAQHFASGTSRLLLGGLERSHNLLLSLVEDHIFRMATHR